MWRNLLPPYTQYPADEKLQLSLRHRFTFNATPYHNLEDNNAYFINGKNSNIINTMLNEE